VVLGVQLKVIMRILRTETGGPDRRLRVFVAETNAADLFWLEMVFKGSRIPCSIEAVLGRQDVTQYLRRTSADLILVDGAALLEQIPNAFVLGNPRERERCADPSRFIEKPFTHQKLFDCLAAADLGAWAARVVPV
jgi:hypothetical protein